MPHKIYKTLDPASTIIKYYIHRRFDLASVVSVDQFVEPNPDHPASLANYPRPSIVVYLRNGPDTPLHGEEAARFLADYEAYAATVTAWGG